MHLKYKMMSLLQIHPYKKLTPNKCTRYDRLQPLLYTVITEYEIAQRYETNDFAFDAWQHLASSLGLKTGTSLRNMCLPNYPSNGAKLGFEQAIILMRETQDFRLFEYFYHHVGLVRK